MSDQHGTELPIIVAKVTAGLEALQSIVQETRSELRVMNGTITLTQSSLLSIRSELTQVIQEVKDLSAVTRGGYNGSGSIIQRLITVEGRLGDLCERLEKWEEAEEQHHEHQFSTGLTFLHGILALVAAIMGTAFGFWLHH